MNLTERSNRLFGRIMGSVAMFWFIRIASPLLALANLASGMAGDTFHGSLVDGLLFLLWSMLAIWAWTEMPHPRDRKEDA